MTDFQIEALADEVIVAFDAGSIPIDLQRIAREECIELVDGEFGNDFHGRIEFLPEVRVFALYHPRLIDGRRQSRVRFSIAHELGHYYIPHHREFLLNGTSHYSLEAFRHKNLLEHQADTFAAALLIPTFELKKRMARRRFLSLPQILGLAEDCNASAQATAFRYTRLTTEPHLALVSEEGRVLFSFASEQARVFGLAGLRDFTVPNPCPTREAMESVGLKEGKIAGADWFQRRAYNPELWEEAIRLGSTNRVLTLLSWTKFKS